MSAPSPGSKYVDVHGRTLRVEHVEPKSKAERHIQGTVDGRAYACSFAVFEAVWLAGALDEAGVLLKLPQVPVVVSDTYAPPKPTPLYRDGKPLPYTRRS